MEEVLVLAEHRRGELREITLEMLSKGRELAAGVGGHLSCLLLGQGVEGLAEALKGWVNTVLVVEDPGLLHFNSDSYQAVLSSVMAERSPIITLIGHTGFGMDLAPSLAARLDLPLVTDCIGLELREGKLLATRQMYGGKVTAVVSSKVAGPQIASVRQGAFKALKAEAAGEIVSLDSPLSEEPIGKRFLEYIEAAVGDVDITQSDVVVAVGRGIKDEKNIPILQELADSLGGVLACSRPVIDAGWLPKDRQVGQSGKTVRPKLYIAMGISGAFQHLTGMQNSETIIAVNKDPDAPIFSVAHYGVVGDLFKVVPALKERIADMKG